MPSRNRSRLFVDEALQTGTELTLPDEHSHYLVRVLRLKVGDELTVFDGRGGEFAATVAESRGSRAILRVGPRVDADRESPLRLHLIQGLSRGERMDFVVQKATELGVQRITPVLTEFSVVKLDAGRRDRRRLHWLRIARSACEQCGRNVVPEIGTPVSLEEWLGGLREDGRLRIVLDPSAATPFGALDPPGSGIDLLVGPEGGFSDGECRQAEAAGFVAGRFGPRVLRTETAAVAAIAALQARWGDLGL